MFSRKERKCRGRKEVGKGKNERKKKKLIFPSLCLIEMMENRETEKGYK